ncbi:MAG: hypothetical protein WCI46_00350 [Verrucomicrobiota bacterium]
MKTKTLSMILLPAVLAVGTGVFWERGGGKRQGDLKWSEAQPVVILGREEIGASGVKSEIIPMETDLADGLGGGILRAEFHGNGREAFQAVMINQGKVACRVQVQAGQVFRNERSAVVVVRPGTLCLEPGETGRIDLKTAGLHSSNPLKVMEFHLDVRKEPGLGGLLLYVFDHPELTIGAIQTAVLGLTENLPLSAVAKFNSAIGGLQSRFDTTAFRVEASEIVAALMILRELGRRDDQVAMSIDPQLKIEAMTDPKSRLMAMRYYGLTKETEWEYWKSELEGGALATRHYALFGIARSYPEIALEMLPKWAREVRTNGVFRRAAIQALATTERAEAVPILDQLAEDLGRYTEMGILAKKGAQYLAMHLPTAGERQSLAIFVVPPSGDRF